jgi:hypothetical protein
MGVLASGIPELNGDQAMALLIVGGAFFVGIVGIVFGCLTNLMRTKAQEQTKREIAAYVAEGSISPEDARRILNASASLGAQIKEKIRDAINA